MKENSELFSIRIGNISATNYYKAPNGEITAKKKCLEILKYELSPYFGKESDYVWDEVQNMYRDPLYSNSFISKECFKHKETAYVLAYIKKEAEDGWNMDWVGSRPVDLPQEEQITFMKVCKLAFEHLNKLEND